MFDLKDFCNSIDFIENDIENIKKDLKIDLTTNKKNDILYSTSRDVSTILKLYAMTNYRKINYKTKQVVIDDTMINLESYENYIKRMTSAYMILANIQKIILGERKYNQIVYAT